MIVNKVLIFSILPLFVLCASCEKWLSLPEDLDYLSDKAGYNQVEFTPDLGTTQVFQNIFNYDDSNVPLHFEITNVRDNSTGDITDVLSREVSTWVWKSAYTGKEKSLAEITNKRVREKRPIWQVREKSGDFILWGSIEKVDFLRLQPDSGYLFDVVATNKGNEVVFEDLLFNPFIGKSYSPNTFNKLTGERIKNYLDPSDSTQFTYEYLHPRVDNIIGDSTDLELESDDVRVLFKKTGEGHSLTFKFLDKDSVLIRPDAFNRTAWDSVVHGFNPVITDEYVTYEVAYPIPVVRLPTKYTNGSGSEAEVKFSYDRVGFDNKREVASISFSFTIIEEGDWELTFYFNRDNPKFRDE